MAVTTSFGYRVHYLIKNQAVFDDHVHATHVRVTQNHLHVYDGDDCLAIYQSGWWIKTHKLDNE